MSICKFWKVCNKNCNICDEYEAEKYPGESDDVAQFLFSDGNETVTERKSELKVESQCTNEICSVGTVKEKIRDILVENKFYAGSSEAAKMLRELADEFDD